MPLTALPLSLIELPRRVSNGRQHKNLFIEPSPLSLTLLDVFIGGGIVKFCGECGKKNAIEAQFCFNCGSKFTSKSNAPLAAPKGKPISVEEPTKVTPAKPKADAVQPPAGPRVSTPPPLPPKPIAPPPPPKPPKPPRPPMSKRTKRKIGIVAGVALLATILVNIPWPLSVTIKVAVATPFGGVFNEDCSLTETGKAEKVDLIQIKPDNNSSDKGLESKLSFSESNGKCLGITNVFVARDTTFKVLMFGSEIGSLTRYEIDGGNDNEETSLSVKRNIEGTISISAKYSNCKQLDAGIDCSVPSGSPITADLHKNVMTCSGTNKFGYLNTSQSLAVTPGSLKNRTAKAKLNVGKAIMQAEDITSGKITCTFKVTFKNVANSDTEFNFAIGSSKFSITATQLEASGWKFEKALN